MDLLAIRPLKMAKSKSMETISAQTATKTSTILPSMYTYSKVANQNEIPIDRR